MKFSEALKHLRETPNDTIKTVCPKCSGNLALKLLQPMNKLYIRCDGECQTMVTV